MTWVVVCQSKAMLVKTWLDFNCCAMALLVTVDIYFEFCLTMFFFQLHAS